MGWFLEKRTIVANQSHRTLRIQYTCDRCRIDQGFPKRNCAGLPNEDVALGNGSRGQGHSGRTEARRMLAVAMRDRPDFGVAPVEGRVQRLPRVVFARNTVSVRHAQEVSRLELVEGNTQRGQQERFLWQACRESTLGAREESSGPCATRNPTDRPSKSGFELAVVTESAIAGSLRNRRRRIRSFVSSWRRRRPTGLAVRREVTRD